MYLSLSFIPFLVMGLLIGLLVWAFLRAIKRSKLRMNRKSTYVFLVAYVAALLVATLAVELIGSQFVASQPKAGSSEEADFLEHAIQNGDIKSIDSSKVIDKRTHNVGKTLTITSRDYDSNTTIIVERKSKNDGSVEETIIKPFLLIDGSDLSDQVKYTKPIWEGNRVIFQIPPSTKITYATYKDAFLLGQFTSRSQQGSDSYISPSRQIAVHLLVPKDLIITADDHLYINYIYE